MKTEDLIDALAAGVEPVRPARPGPLMIGLAAVVAMTAVALLLGVRPDLGVALWGPAPWLKGFYTAALTVGSLGLATRLGRPGVDWRPALAALLAVVAAALIWGGIELGLAAPGERLGDWLGRTWTICGRNILMISAATAPLVFLAARQMAPTRPSLAGGALGAAAGGIAATAYGLLHCPESTAAFVATWYTLGVAAAALIGAGAGRLALRW